MKRFILLFIVIYIFYLYFNTYKNEDIHSKRVYVISKEWIKVDRINSKFIIKTRLEKNNYKLDKNSTYIIYYNNGDYVCHKETYLSKIRRRISSYIDKIYKKRVLSYYLKAILLNDKTSIPKKQKEILKDNAVYHLFSISGLHISCIYLVLNKSLFFLKDKTIQIVAFLFITIYTFTISISPSTIRAYIMLLILIISKILDEKYSAKKAFTFSLLLSVLYNPYQILELSFLYTYSSTFCLIFFDKDSILNKLFYIQILNIPLNLIYFSRVNLISFLLNIVIIPLLSLLIILIIIYFIAPIMLIETITTTYLEIIFNIMDNIRRYNIFNFNISINKYILIIIYIIILFSLLKEAVNLKKK